MLLLGCRACRGDAVEHPHPLGPLSAIPKNSSHPAGGFDDDEKTPLPASALSTGSRVEWVLGSLQGSSWCRRVLRREK